MLIVVLGGAAVRFAGLGDVGLHGDEETMALAVRGIIEQGMPYLPSGMYYPRALGQLYMMAGSVMLFGWSEWAMRLPSVICGIVLIPLVFIFSRRFLQFPFALLLAGAVAFLPEFIEYSQTARMYIFMVASLVIFALAVHEWERSGSRLMLTGAVFALLVAIHFHSLSILASGLFFFPGIVQGNIRRLGEGIVALFVSAIGFLLIDTWVESQYPEAPSREAAVDALRSGRRSLSLFVDNWSLLQLAIGVAVVVALVLWVVRRVSHTGEKIAAAVLLAAGLLAQIFVSYHVAAFLLLAGVLLSWPQTGTVAAATFKGRSHTAAFLPLAVLASVSVGLAIVHVLALQSAGVDSISRIIGALSGLPSMWPYVRLASFSWMAALIVGAGLIVALWRLAHRRPLADYWLFFFLACFLPLLPLGVARWNIPPRYAIASVVPLLLVAFAVLQEAFARGNGVLSERPMMWRRTSTVVAAVLAAVLVIDPVKFQANVNSGYAHHPDHKGAAQFVNSLRLGPNDLVLAEDVLQQSWYLGNVDYWLIGPEVGGLFSQTVDGEVIDIYTHTRILDSAAKLESMLADGSRSIYIIGSGENQQDGRREMRGEQLHEFLESRNLETVYVGRDGRTKVWRVQGVSPSQLADMPAAEPGSAAIVPVDATPPGMPGAIFKQVEN